MTTTDRRGPLAGVRVVEVAGWTFVPAAGAILGDLGADVIKVEPPTGDPQRGLTSLLNLSGGDINPFNEIPNRGKRSITVDLTHAEGRAVLLKVIEGADVFLTSTLADNRKRMGIEPEDLLAVNPKLIYMRGTGWGDKGPMRNVGGFDAAAAYAASGAAFKMTAEGGEPPGQPPAFFDLQGATTIAGAVGMALFKRERTGEGSVIDVSLLNVGMWVLGMDVMASPFIGEVPRIDRRSPGNPLTNWYRTQDGRWLMLVLLQADRYWVELCTLLKCEHLIDDPRYADAGLRFTNREECVRELDAVFGAEPLAVWIERLATFTGVWSPALSPIEVHDHVQMAPNGYLAELKTHTGVPFQVVSPPMQFDDTAGAPIGPAPELGQHTEEVLLEAGVDWDGISAWRDSGALG